MRRKKGGIRAMPTASQHPDRPVTVLGTPVPDYPDRAPEAARGSVRRVTVAGEEILHRRLRPVEPGEFGGAELSALIDDMFATMYVADGVGLAANQVGVDLRLFVYDCTDEDGARHVGHVCNPVIDEVPAESRSLDEDDEGCLSVPGPYKKVARLEHATVRGTDRHGNGIVIEGSGYFARCLQHETDHVDGYLYIDRISKRERKDALKQMEAQQDGIFARRAERAQALAK
jgi:peptide deformylase